MRTCLFFVLFIAIFTINAHADNGLLWLVNRENPLCEDFYPPKLVNYRGIKLREEARDAFTEMLAAMEAEKIYGLRLQSAYRCFSHQRDIFEAKKRTLIADGTAPSNAAALAAKTVQPPGASEHQLGLALDVTLDGQLSQNFAGTAAGLWLAENCHRFGFIIRYPREKTDITDIIFEPWHLRYVGRPHAQIMCENALTLEEYHPFLALIKMYVVWENDGYSLVSFSPEPPAHGNFSAISPKNNAAFIVTDTKTSVAPNRPKPVQ